MSITNSEAFKSQLKERMTEARRPLNNTILKVLKNKK